MLGGPLGQQVTRIQHGGPGQHQQPGEASAETHKQYQAQAYMTHGYRAEQQNQRRWARHQPSACSQRDQASQRHVTFRNMAVAVRTRVCMAVVMMMMMMVV